MKKILMTIMAIVAGIAAASAALTADWKTYMPFDEWPVQVTETPGRVYFLSRTFQFDAGIPDRDVASHSLFYYDKEGDEIVSVNARSNASGNAVARIAYNVMKKYLLVVYTDCNIDFIYDDGRVYNLPALKEATIPGKKEANAISFHHMSNRAYVATTFGYIALNDDKHEVAESRTYGENVSDIIRAGDEMVMIVGNKIYHAPASEQRYSLNDYTQIADAPGADGLLSLRGGPFIAYLSQGGYIDKYTPGDDGSYSRERLTDDPRIVNRQPRGEYSHALAGNVRIFFINERGEMTTTVRGQEDYGLPATSLTNEEMWVLHARKGLKGFRRGAEGWALAHDYMRPNAPATYISSALTYHPDYGMLCGSNGTDYAFDVLSQNTPSNISALKGGLWKEYGYSYSGSEAFGNEVSTYGGVSVDPSNPRIVWRAKTLGGLMRVDLANPADVMIFANPSFGGAGKPGFVKIVEDQQAWNVLCHFTVPSFTPDGTLWSLHHNEDEGRAYLYYWKAADRNATTSPATFRGLGRIAMPDLFPSDNFIVMTALKHNPNIIVAGRYGQELLFYDHNGTPDNTSDDRWVVTNVLRDQYGSGVSLLKVNNLVEDPETGIVYIMSQRGLFTVNPREIFSDPMRVNRLLVDRNDGTGYADYLLSEVNVLNMTVDGEGRKWFATSNGLFCTSPDCRTVLGEFNKENSYLPGDGIYTMAYNPENRSMMVATDGGLVEMFPSGGGGGTANDSGKARVYPNPVEPDFYGWVRIDNVADGSVVKITDARGGIVKELGPVQGGGVEWDVSGLDNTRVSTGVYYVMISPGTQGGNAEIQKILVLN